jgi:membrane protease YdiL (CAAX protease family)
LLLGASYAITIAALIVLLVVNDANERHAVRQRLTTWRAGWKWYVIAILLPPLVWFTGIGISAALGGGFPFHPTLFAIYPAIFIANVGEEIGWRGFALPRLQTRTSPLRASLVLGVLWGLIHLPLNLQFPYFLFATALLTAMAIIMTWIFNNTAGSVLLMVLFHCGLDIAQFVSPHGQTSDPIRAYALIVIGMWLVAGIVIWRTHSRLGRREPQPHPPAFPEGRYA